MNNITTKDSSIYYTDKNEKLHLLLDGIHTIRNVSTVTLQDFRGCVPFTDYLQNLNEIYATLTDIEPENQNEYFIITCLIANKLIECYKSGNILEIGCNSGMLSWNIIKLLMLFNNGSTICSVSNTIGNYSNNYWLDVVGYDLDKVDASLVISDYNALPVTENHFEVVVLNGHCIEENLFPIIQNTTRFLSSNGLYVAFINQNKNECLHQLSKVVSAWENIEISDEISIIFFTDNEVIKPKNDITILYETILEKYQKFIDMTLSNTITAKDADSFLVDCKKAIDLAILKKENDMKINIINMRREILNAIYKD